MTQPFDPYAEYCAWYLQHYGYPFPVTREQWQQWCRAPHRRAELMDLNPTCDDDWTRYDGELL